MAPDVAGEDGLLFEDLSAHVALVLARADAVHVAHVLVLRRTRHHLPAQVTRVLGQVGGVGLLRGRRKNVVEVCKRGSFIWREFMPNTVETAYKVYVCPRRNLLYMRIYLITNLKLL